LKQNGGKDGNGEFAMNAIRSTLLILLAAASLAAPLAAQARGGAPMVTFENIAFSDGRSLTLEQVKRAVIRAASSREWAASLKNDSTVRATYTKGRHSAVVDIVFTQSSYSIRYVDSNDLNYSDKDGKATIHPAYNKAVTALRQSIDAQLRTIS
jgi:hypothetical protein